MTDRNGVDWGGIVDRHAKCVFRVAMRILGSVQDAEDVSQDVFMEAFQLHSKTTVRNWTGLLVRLATLRSIDRLRRKRASVELSETDRMSRVEPFDELAADELARWLRNAVIQLPDQQSAVFVMFHFEQMPREEIAAALDMTPEAVSTALYKARQRLMSELTLCNRGDLK